MFHVADEKAYEYGCVFEEGIFAREEYREIIQRVDEGEEEIITREEY